MGDFAGAAGRLLLVGASRGIGLAMAGEFLTRGWEVLATMRPGRPGGLDALGDRFGPRLLVEILDVVDPNGIAALAERSSGRPFDVLFVNAGTANMRDETAAEIDVGEFERVMVVNALAPLRVVEGLAHLVRPDGVVGVMSSGQGSVANNGNGRHEVYRASKAALNQLMRSYAARRAGARALVLMAPGWIRTDLGGPDAPVGVEEAVAMVVDVLLSATGVPGLRYLDRFGNEVPW